jgi:hypothetical protein
MPLNAEMNEVLDAQSPNAYELTLERLQEVFEEDVDEDLKPSPSALDRAERLVKSFVGEKATFPLAWVCPEGDGGLRLTWTSADGESKVHVIVPPNRSEDLRLIYFSVDSQEPLIQRLTCHQDLGLYLSKIA